MSISRFFSKKKRKLAEITTYCHSLSPVITRCTTRCHSLSLVVIRCHSLYHPLSLVVNRCITRLIFYKRSFQIAAYPSGYIVKLIYRLVTTQSKSNPHEWWCKLHQIQWKIHQKIYSMEAKWTTPFLFLWELHNSDLSLVILNNSAKMTLKYC